MVFANRDFTVLFCYNNKQNAVCLIRQTDGAAARIHLENAERTLMIAMSERKGGEELRNSLGAKK